MEETNLYWRNKEINQVQNMDANVRKVKVLSRGEIDEMVFRHCGLAHLQVSRLCPANMCPKIPKCVRRKEGISRNLVSSSFFEKKYILFRADSWREISIDCFQCMTRVYKTGRNVL